MASSPFDLGQMASDWVWESDRDHRMTLLSEPVEDLTGIPAESGIGERRDEGSANADDRAFWGPHIDDLVHHRPFRAFVYPRRAPDGTLRWLKVSGRPAFDAAGRFAGYRGVGTDITAERTREAQLREALAEARRARAEFELALAHMANGLVMLDAERRITVVNRRFLDLFGLSGETIRPGIDAAVMVAASAARGNYVGLTPEGAWDAFRLRLSRRDRQETTQLLPGDRHVAIVVVPTDGGGWVTTYEEVTETVRAARALKEQNRRFDAALSHMSHGLCMFDEALRILVVNRRYLELYGFDPTIVAPGTSLRDVTRYATHLGLHVGDPDELFRAYQSALVERRETVIHRELADGRTVEISHDRMPGGGWVAIHEDITGRRAADRRLAHMATHDALTNLPNRLLLQERLAEALASGRPDGREVAVHCLDLDQFKPVNDTLGHSIGDALLVAVAERLRATAGPDDTVARLGGDEFAVAQRVAGPHAAGDLARRLVEAIGAPFEVAGHTLVIGASVGVALTPGDGRNAGALLGNADLALYRAKADGRGRHRFFEPGMDAAVKARRTLEVDLRTAFARGEFELWYQAQVDATTTRVQGFEALLRWRHPERGVIAPDRFIGVAEEIGLIVPLGEWVLRQACREAVGWPGDVRVAVNISAKQFITGTFELAVVTALAASGLAPRRLELEITESVLLAESDATLSILHRLRALGVRVSMDDFGTGYSSLSYLRAFPFDKIKIDRSFIRDLVEREDCAVIVEAIASLAAKLGMTTTAEGVETREQLDMVRAMGCTEVQGFLFSRPCPASDVPALLAGGASDRDPLRFVA